MSKTSLIIHIVFGTKRRKSSIDVDRKRELYAYIHGIIKKKDCVTIRINGVSDHTHILIDLHPSVAVADLVKAVKQSTANWLKVNPIFPNFDGWARGYYAASVDHTRLLQVKNYIINQEKHHLATSFLEEIEMSVKEVGMEYREDDWQ